MFYLLVVAALGDELRSREPPCEKSQRTETCFSNGTRHVDNLDECRSLGRGQLEASCATCVHTSLLGEGLK